MNIWDELSKVYNMPGIPDEAMSIIGDVMLAWSESQGAQPEQRSFSRSHEDDLISRKAAIDGLNVGAEVLRRVLADTDIVGAEREKFKWGLGLLESCISDMKELPSAQQEYEPVTAEDFVKTMSENTLYGFMAWHGEAIALMKEQGFVICKKTI